MESFGIRPDYRPNPPQSNDEITGTAYWTPERVSASTRHPWSVYRLARTVAAETGARTIVDVGCGVATKLNLLFGPEFDIYGIDQASAVAVCRELHARGTYLAEDLDRPDAEARAAPCRR